MKNEIWNRRLRSLVLLAALATAAGAEGCAPAVVGAGAGAAGTAYLTSRGAKAAVKGTPDRLQDKSEQVLSENAIQVTGSKIEKGGAHREIEGKKNDLDVSISIDRRDDQTSDVEVKAKKNAVEWDKQYAESLLNSIIKKT